jgi:hypothetical protein
MPTSRAILPSSKPDFPARVGEARDQTQFDRLASSSHYDRDRRRRLFATMTVGVPIVTITSTPRPTRSATLGSLAFIEKDTTRFPNTHGWAYA